MCVQPFSQFDSNATGIGKKRERQSKCFNFAIRHFEMDALGFKLLAKLPEVLNFEAYVINSGSESGLSWVLALPKLRLVPGTFVVVAIVPRGRISKSKFPHTSPAGSHSPA